MSKTPTVIVIVLLAITAVGAWATFSVENERKNFELRQMEAQRQTALDNDAFTAWKHATRYETFGSELENSPQQPKRNDTYTERTVWVKSFQKTDIKPSGTSQKYGNAAYLVSTVISINDKASHGLIEFMIRKSAPVNTIQAAVQGEWHVLTMQCKAERLDGGDWITSDFKFSPVATKPEFPFERVKAE
jgi:hypothetical protein